MKKKQLNEAAIVNELKGNSLFFQRPAQEAPSVISEEVTPPPSIKPRRTKRLYNPPPTTPVAEPPPITPSLPAAISSSTDDTPPPAAQDTTDQDITDQVTAPPLSEPVAPQFPSELIETLRRNVKQLGKEATFCRFTEEEKSALTDIIYYYKTNGVRTSENEIIRIAFNFLLENYRAHSNKSLLAKVLNQLNA